MNFNKFGLGKGGFFGVCDGLSNFTGIPVLAFRILALFLMYKGLFIFYWYAWILLFVSNVSSGKKRETIININLSNDKANNNDSSSNSDSNNNSDSEVWESFHQKFNTAWKKTKDKKVKKKKKSSDKKMSFDDFKTKHFNN